MSSYLRSFIFGLLTISLAQCSPILKDTKDTKFSTGSNISLKKRDTNVFDSVVDTINPASYFGTVSHPVTPAGVSTDSLSSPIETNKFFDNNLLGSRTNFMYADPFRYWWQSSDTMGGICIAHTDDNQRVMDTDDTIPSYYYEPIGICSLGFGASGITSNTDPIVDEIDQMSARFTFSWDSSSMQLTLTEGMAVTTAVYTNAIPQIFSSTLYINDFVEVPGTSAVQKYRVTMSDNHVWLIYIYGDSLTLTESTSQMLVGSNTFNGYIQIAKIPLGDGTAEALYDTYAGVYITGISISGYVEDAVGYYSFDFTTAGDTSVEPLFFLLPHQVDTAVSGTKVTSIVLASLVSGDMNAAAGNSITFAEAIPQDIGFLPWSPTGGQIGYSEEALEIIAEVAGTELGEDFSANSNLNSMYYSGKVLAKYAMLCVTINDILGDETSSEQCIQKLEAAFARFVDNQQIYPLTYDNTWKGVVSVAGLSGDSLADFGNSYYNDHHFHYGYFVFTAAVIGHIDPDWINTGNNKEWVNFLVRDVANPSSNDPYFPKHRMIDIYHGHGWASGLFESNDGKDEESTSEDYNFFFGMKLWGQVIGDSDMEDRANIILGIERNALNKYMLYADGNVQPTSMQPNYVAGITFMNKITHTTYFGTNIEYIQGIHMLPITPISAFIRGPSFVLAEWNALLASVIDYVDSGWRSLLYANLAIAEPEESYEYFSSSDFNTDYLDDGASRAWYLAYAAGLWANDAVYYPVSSSSTTTTSTSTGSVTTTSTTATASCTLPISYTSTPTTTSISGTCNGATFDASLYVCDGTVLCPIVNGVSYQNCNGACYNPSQYGCDNGALGPVQSSSTTSSITPTPTTTSSITPTPTTTSTTTTAQSTGMQLCGSNYYDASSYYCDNDQLCPIIDGVDYLSCNGACYNPSQYVCSDGSLSPNTVTTTKATTTFTPTPTTTTTPTPTTTSATSTNVIAQCGSAWYDSQSYICYGNILCPIINGSPLLACGNACYDSSIYGCSNGALVAA
ncbi:cell septum surface endo-1,3-beta-glucanase Eng1 [Schizosaccharomyces pombe]|uniref:Primary septum glucan endo-1,3-beta-D-glucosidase n=1 Tax=Schizosaccharomyces pombe (strain 972 / ATCC 24843) TaxID=284812 RepID=ENG1_SCHPO|nr:endo-1,3-beta-glucanase Eng1 [Schizosaccharomyces pombe]Q9UT45.1 RecName: Full=Primary septum glucan endo-1,3-beta-D-glucosidase; AltName: Full=Glucan endo-1,3-beta-D-glucosidase 1; Short=Endo-1,3-beta-glucanase 1; AltName: Full=Laminarinase-1; Flags: Precursor [Schizosaccharomyces pombe 972h-]CAB57443.1 endo-1,3-beta-glucanase Eng1 [Schizosaccharomyces pombe]|eukprot:NP_593162.1 endo-1,3-beta-glucanase Eng1 [Schizosaccharomyces pombe]